MALLPSDFGLPPLPYLVGLLFGLSVAVFACYRRRPPVTAPVVVGFAPWMAAGGCLYALFRVDAFPSALAPLFGSPAVYLTVGTVAAVVWAAVADRSGDGWGVDTASGALLVSGTAVAVGGLFAALALGVSRGSLALIWPVAAVGGSIVTTAVVWSVLTRLTDAGVTGGAGVVVVFAHALDGISTAIAVDRLGFGEQVPLSRLIIEFGASLPIVSGGMLFTVVKLAVAGVVVALFVDYVRDAPAEAYLLLTVIAAVGLGPGAHNVVLFTLG
ncbi:MAG: DUF63 family protein [Natronomonas sp.]